MVGPKTNPLNERTPQGAKKMTRGALERVASWWKENAFVLSNYDIFSKGQPGTDIIPEATQQFKTTLTRRAKPMNPRLKRTCDLAAKHHLKSP